MAKNILDSSLQRFLRRPYGLKDLTKKRKTNLFLLFLFCIVGFLVTLTFTPPISRDALTHHLAIPKRYLLHGGIYEIPELIFSYYPMNLDLLYFIPLWFGNDILPKFIHLSFGLGTSWLIFVYLEKRLGRNWGLTGALFFLTTPIIVSLASTAYVDLGVTFFTTISLLLLLSWTKTNELKTIILAGIFAGLAAGTKYNGLLTIFLLTCFTPFIVLHSHKPISSKRAIGLASLFFLCAILAVSPWLIRNYIWTGNPIYPLFQSLFANEGSPLTQGMNPFLIRKLAYDESLWQTLLIPIRIFFEGQDNDPKYFDGVLNPFILLFALTAFLPNYSIPSFKTEKKLFFWFIILFLLFAFVQRVIRIRYIVPVLPFLIILSILGLYNIKSYLMTLRCYSRMATFFPTLLLLAALSLNGLYMVRYWQKIRPLQYLSGQTDRTAFITRFWPEYTLINWANKNLAQSSTILAVFLGNRGYYFDRPVEFDLKSGRSLLCSTIKEQDSAKNISDSLTKSGISHILLRKDLFGTWCWEHLDAMERKRLTDFFNNHTQELNATSTHSLFALKKI